MFFIFCSTDAYLVTGLSMIAEVGGMAGLLLGISFFHTTKLIGFLITMKIDKLKENFDKTRKDQKK